MIEIDIPMPQKCGLCPCFHFENPMYCQAVKADKYKKIVAPYGLPRPEWCPLKEQEPQPVKVVKITYNHKFYYCPKCDRSFDELLYGKPKFCDMCGQEVKWDD